ncbi:MAG: MBL fold metallo-hydrolase [Candidatus Nanohalobium sp.]
MELKFLGTGGSRFVTASQRRRTAGIVVKTGETQIHVDPGPGALVYANSSLESPESTEAVVVSHAHLDHASDAEPIIEMITEGNDHPGAVFANKTVLEGYGDIEKSVSDYYQDLCQDVNAIVDGSRCEFKDVVIQVQEMSHGDPKTAGFTIEDREQKIGFWTDSDYLEDLTGFYEGCDVLVTYCTMPRGKSIKGHTSVDEAAAIAEKVQPNTMIVTHFGMSLLNEDLEKQKEWLDKNTECKVVFAEDGMKFPGNRSLGDF